MGKIVISFLRWSLGPSLAAIVWINLDPNQVGPLSPEAIRLAGLMVWVVLWWICEPIPIPVTALFGTCLVIILGVADSKAAFSGYGHPLIYLFLGGFLLAKSMSIHGLDRRIALWILTREFVRDRPHRILMALLGVTAFLSMWLSNTATTAMLLPISLVILKAILPDDGNRNTHGKILLAVAYASSIGGVATPIGSTPNIIALGLLENTANIRILFLEWMAITFPIMITFLGILMLYVRWRIPELPLRKDTSFLHQEYYRLGPLSPAEKHTLFAIATAVTLWLVPGILSIFFSKGHPLPLWFKNHFPTEVAALLGASLLFLFRTDRPTLTWKEAIEIDWGALLLFGGGLSLGTLMFTTGLAPALGEVLVQVTGEDSFWIFVGVSVFFAIFFTETTSNTATANMLIPLVIAASQRAGHSPLLASIGVALACSFAFMLPVSTPPNAIVYGSGKVQIFQMIRMGSVLNLVGGGVILVFLFILSYIL